MALLDNGTEVKDPAPVGSHHTRRMYVLLAGIVCTNLQRRQRGVVQGHVGACETTCQVSVCGAPSRVLGDMAQ